MTEFADDDLNELIDDFKESVDEYIVRYFNSSELEIIIEVLIDDGDFEYAKKAIHKAIVQFPEYEYFRILSIKYHLINMNITQAKEELHEYELGFTPSVDFYKEKVLLAKITGEKSTNRMQLLLKALKLDANDPETHFLLANEYLILGKPHSASYHAIRTMQLDADYHYQIWEYAIICEQEEKFKEALYFFKRLIDHYPLQKECWQGYALALVWNEQYSDAIEANEYVLSIDSETTDAHYNIGKIYFEQKNYQQAIRSFLYAYELDKSDIHSLLSIAQCYSALGDIDKNMEYLNRVRLIYPNNLDAVLGIIQTLCEKHQYNEARTFTEHELYSGNVSPELIFKSIDLLFKTDGSHDITDSATENSENLCLQWDENHYEQIKQYFIIAVKNGQNKDDFLFQFSLFCCQYNRSKIGVQLFSTLLPKGMLFFEKHIWNYYYAALLLTAGDLQKGIVFLEHSLCVDLESLAFFLAINHHLLSLEIVTELIDKYSNH